LSSGSWIGHTDSGRNLGWLSREAEATGFDGAVGDPKKIKIALRLRKETTMTLAWIAKRLHLGAKTHPSHLLYGHHRRHR